VPIAAVDADRFRATSFAWALLLPGDAGPLGRAMLGAAISRHFSFAAEKAALSLEK
jgi:hypothetical protein